MRHALSLITLALATAASAQSHIAPPPDPTGTVSGHVFCSDTNQPARFAHVSLQAIPSPAKTRATAKPTASSSLPAPDTSGAGKVETSLDGSFTLTHVKPGAYYIVVEKEGYLGPLDTFTQAQLADASPEALAQHTASVPHVVVEANQTENAEIRLDRGASITGTILYDDGTPASELHVQLLHKDATGKWVPLEFNGTQYGWASTDDRGSFHLASLLADDYIVQADLALASSNTSKLKGPGDMLIMLDVQTFHFSLPFYGSGTAHLSEAKPITLRAGQDTPGQDMVIPIAKLHKLAGRVAAGRDGHFVNAATVALISREDNKEIASTDISRDDGLFHFEFVPEGDYTLKVSGARDVAWDPPTPTKDNPFPQKDVERVLASFGDAEQTILLRGDQLDALATVSPDAVPAAAPAATKSVQASTGIAPDAAPEDHPSTHSTPQTNPEATPQSNTASSSALR